MSSCVVKRYEWFGSRPQWRQVGEPVATREEAGRIAASLGKVQWRIVERP